eukprot:350131-Chlamydomonas_euryale.AAC.5
MCMTAHVHGGVVCVRVCVGGGVRTEAARASGPRMCAFKGVSLPITETISDSPSGRDCGQPTLCSASTRRAVASVVRGACRPQLRLAAARAIASATRSLAQPTHPRAERPARRPRSVGVLRARARRAARDWSAI